MTVSRARARGGPATAGILALAVICFAGALQLRPIPTADLNHLVAEAADPASVQRCTTISQVRYCLYPGFGRQLPSLQAPVNGVLAHLPARPDRPLTVRQVMSLYLPDSTLTHGHPKRQVSRWEAQLQRAPGNAATASAIYLPVSSWPAAGGRLGDARFDVALAAAEWAVRLPSQATGSINGSVFLPCVPLGQAREAIAAAACAGRSRYADLSGVIAALASFAAIALAWYAPVSARFLVEPPATAHGVTIAWYAIATAASALSCVAMRDQWHRYTRSLQRLSSSQRSLRKEPHSAQLAGRCRHKAHKRRRTRMAGACIRSW